MFNLNFTICHKETLSLLNQWHLSLNNRLQRHGYTNNLDLIFPSTRHGYVGIHNPNWCYKVLKTLQHKFPQLKPVDVHGFRHTWATLALDAGLDVSDVQKQLGHSSYATTMNVYGKYSKHQKEKATKKMEAYWSKKVEAKNNSGFHPICLILCHFAPFRVFAGSQNGSQSDL